MLFDSSAMEQDHYTLNRKSIAKLTILIIMFSNDC